MKVKIPIISEVATVCIDARFFFFYFRTLECFRYCRLKLQPLLTESTVHINNSKKLFDKNDFVTLIPKLCWRAVSETFLACFENHFTFFEEPTVDANNFILKNKTFQKAKDQC